MPQPPPNALGVYISIPFCRSKCTYCNFASGVYPASEHTRYIHRLIEDMRRSHAWAAQMGGDLPRTVDTVYLGGGTPSLLEPHLIERLFAALRVEFHLTPDAEITVECAPAQIADATLAALAQAGVNRVSLGVQSFIDREAHSSGRLHNRAAVLSDLQRLRSAGITNLNIDLIAGLAGQTFASWDESLAVLLDTGIPHASIYMLEVDEDSRLGREMLSGGARYHAELVPSDDAIAGMYETAVERLAASGLAQYEISNFSRPGLASLHNLRYWQRRPYLGLGLDASSMLLDSEAAYALRSKTADDLKSYLEDTESPETAWLSPDRRHEEAWFLGLRMNSGVNASALATEFGHSRVAPALEAANRLAQDGLLTTDGDHIRLTPRGRLLSNDVFQEFLSLDADESEAQPPVFESALESRN
ncbi:radical SAM family heme chaperone HemW [Terracidiphilus sp.]|jgi:oxygen-independent coproporphyrinogen-3 oxidase|uniref:radical SAM family heme chaperone HemW n=1 Tax=Terracidiphilus sp. TaxID=1964191 RepID=UPI003C1A22F8